MRQRARAQALVWIVVLIPLLFLPIVGLSIDAGVMFDARRDLQNAVDGAARAGAQRIDTSRLAGRNGRMLIDKDKATATVEDYAERVGLQDEIGQPKFSDDGTEIRVPSTRTVKTRFLRIIHLNEFKIQATGSAIACEGIVDSECRR